MQRGQSYAEGQPGEEDFGLHYCVTDEHMRLRRCGPRNLLCDYPDTPFAEAGHHIVHIAERDALGNNESCEVCYRRLSTKHFPSPLMNLSRRRFATPSAQKRSLSCTDSIPLSKIHLVASIFVWTAA